MQRRRPFGGVASKTLRQKKWPGEGPAIPSGGDARRRRKRYCAKQ
jgi:hypothetical protein